ncbi:TIGR03619 family F420-dependent LLM class oxidoreductase [Herbiconiux sp. P15]|uniref:TIGR03619 family F420-dependent LLM class oxidoreductase n=1 Tax=Herbiconiux liukaitaii TaxID=3342799 RepID=UPI0035B719C3
MPTHGVMRRAGAVTEQTSVPARELRILELALRAEELGFDSLWFGDHVVMDRDLDPNHPAGGGSRSHPEGCVMIDPLTAMAMCAAVTQRIRVGSSVLIAPYRHPLTVAHAFASMDQLSAGRVDMGVGPGWMRSEFEALGAQVDERFTVTEESIRVYLAAWTEEWPSFSGSHFSFDRISVEPKPLQNPHVPIYYGAMTPAGARVAARWCQGVYPMLIGDGSRPGDHRRLVESINSEAHTVDRDLTGFRMLAFATGAVVSPRRAGVPRPLLSGTADEVLDDLEALGVEGYDHVTIYPDARSGTVDEVFELVERLGEEVVGPAGPIRTERVFG